MLIELRHSDHYALVENRQTSSSECRVLCSLCDGFIFVWTNSLYHSETSLISIHRIIGIQSFKGSLRRTCFVQATDTPSTLGVIIAEEIQLEGRFCGAFIDPTTLERVPYLLLNGENAPAPKGYTCPLGQVCKVRPSFESPKRIPGE